MTFANAVLMSVPSFLWTTTESTKHKKVEANSFDEICEEKKATSFEKLHEMKKKKERTSETANCISLQKRRYILFRKYYLPQNA